MQLPQDKKYTYADYVTWGDDKRYELIDGEIYMMSAPSLDHQAISRELSRRLANYLDGKTCEVFSAPCDVRLNAGAEDNTVVQPDIIVVCDPEKIKDRKTCQGAPDLIIEILSPSTASYDQIVKLNQYLKAGVREFWLVSPELRSVLVYLLKNGEYVIKPYDDTGIIAVNILEDCQITLAAVFPPAPPEDFPSSSTGRNAERTGNSY